MTDLQQQFENAQAAVKTLPERPDNATLLKLYVLFKQSTEGDVSGDRPDMMDFVARAKFDAWAELEGTSKEVAMTRYIELVNRLMA